MTLAFARAVQPVELPSVRQRVVNRLTPFLKRWGNGDGPSQYTPRPAREQAAREALELLDAALAKLGDTAAAMQNRRMVAPAERIANFRQAVIGQLLGKRHGHLPRPGDGSASPP